MYAADDPTTAECPATVEQRVEALESMGMQVCSAVESLAEMLVKVQNQAGAQTDADTRAELTRLASRIQQLEAHAQLQSTCADLARTSQFHEKRPRVVFVGTTYFGCNAKYGWLAFRDAARVAGIECWFLPQNADQEQAVRSLNEPCFPADANHWTAEHVSVALSTAVVVTCDHFLNPNPFAAALLAGARHVQLWHGISIKEIGLGNLRPLRHMNPHLARVLATCGAFQHLIGTSAAQESEFRRWFGFQHYAPIGYPRNDVLLREPTAADLLGIDRQSLDLARNARQSGRRVVLYAPTFRDARRGVWIKDAGLERLSTEMARQGSTLIVALHPVEAPLIPQLRAVAPSAHFVAPRTDLYPLLREVDVLITDYSSIMFDYLLLDRPIVIYRPDHDDYVKNSRQLYDAKLVNARVGASVSTLAELLKTLQQRDAMGERYASDRQVLKQTLFDQPDGKSGERLNELLLREVATVCQRSAA